MAVTASIITCGDKLTVGPLDCSQIPGVPKVIPGTLVANGPCWFGLGVPVPTAGVMIGPPLGIPVAPSLEVKGISNHFGVINVIGVSNFTGLCTKNGVTVRNSSSITNGVNNKNSLNVGNGPNTFNGLVTCNGVLKVVGVLKCGVITSLWLDGQIKKALASPAKSFDIEHPTKGKGHRLRHVSLEGPEIGVYVRGVLKGDNEIQLPYYWKDLVDEDSITVQLTPIGKHQNLCYNVAKMKDRISILVNPHEFNTHYIHCSYIVHATRKDLEPLITEYEGESMEDYPGKEFVGANMTMGEDE